MNKKHFIETWASIFKNTGLCLDIINLFEEDCKIRKWDFKEMFDTVKLYI